MKIDILVNQKFDQKNVIVGHFYLEKQIEIVNGRPRVYLKSAGKNVRLLPLSEALKEFPECFPTNEKNKSQDSTAQSL